MSGPQEGEVYGRFVKAFAAVTAIRKDQQNSHHKYRYRGIDDVLTALHGILADHGLFYAPRCVGETYEEWQTSKGGRLQVARLSYCFDFYAEDGSSLVVGPVVGQSADTDDKAPMQALSQSGKNALLHAFCIPTEDMAEGDAKSPVSGAGGRAAAPAEQPKPPPLTPQQEAVKTAVSSLDDPQRATLKGLWEDAGLPLELNSLTGEQCEQAMGLVDKVGSVPF